MGEVKKFIFDSGFLFSAQALTTILAAASNIILIRLLGIANAGLYAMVLSIFFIFGMLSLMGVNGAVTKYISENKKDRAAVSTIILNSFVIFAFTCFIFSLVLYFGSSYLAGIFQKFEYGMLSFLLKFVVIALPFYSFNQLIYSTLMGFRRMKTASFYFVLQSLLQSILIIAVLAAGYDIVVVFYAFILAHIISFLIGLLIIRKEVYSRRSISLRSSSYYSKLLKFGSVTFLSSSINTAAYRADFFLIGFFLGDFFTGIYSFYLSASRLLVVISQVLNNNLFPFISQYSKDLAYVKNAVIKNIKLMGVVSSLFLFSLVIFSKYLLELLLPIEYVDNIIVLYLLSLAMVFAAFYRVHGALFTGMARLGSITIISITGAVSSIVLNILFIPLMGLIGAAFASLFSYFSIMALSVFLFPAYRRDYLKSYSLILFVFSPLLFILVISALSSFGLLIDAILFIAGLGIYILLLFRFFISHDEMRILKNFFKLVINFLHF